MQGAGSQGFPHTAGSREGPLLRGEAGEGGPGLDCAGGGAELLRDRPTEAGSQLGQHVGRQGAEPHDLSPRPPRPGRREAGRHLLTKLPWGSFLACESTGWSGGGGAQADGHAVGVQQPPTAGLRGGHP